MDSSLPAILVVDDDPDRQRSDLSIQEADALINVVHPRDVQENDLRSADLVLVDLRLEDWRERDTAECFGLRVPNGAALAGVLRGYTDRFEGEPTAFALRSAHLEDYSGGFPPQSCEHSIARRLNLEWVFEKKDSLSRMARLAQAVASLPAKWPSDDNAAVRQISQEFLGLSGVDWIDDAWRDVLRCFPPLHQLSAGSHGLAFLRWFLHRILPYPCFLYDLTKVAARLRVTPDSLQKALKGELGVLLDSCRYKGQLAEFSGPRWWRSGLETFIFDLTGGGSTDPQHVLSRLEERAHCQLSLVDIAQPVVGVDALLQPIPRLVDPKTAVRIQPDDWPPYADQAWTTVELALEWPALNAIVIERDREKVDALGGQANGG